MLSLRDTQPTEGTRPSPESPILSATPRVSCSSSLKDGVSFLVLLLTSPTTGCGGGWPEDQGMCRSCRNPENGKELRQKCPGFMALGR